MKIFKSCDTLPIYNFYKIFETKDLKYLVKDFDFDEDIAFTNEEIELLNNTFEKITYEYGDLTDNQKLKFEYKKRILIAELELKYNVCSKVLEIYKDYEEFEVLLVLREFDYVVKEDENINEKIQKITRDLIGLKNRIKIHKTKLNKSKEKKEKEVVKLDLDREVAILEVNLSLGYSIDTRVMPVSKFEGLKRLDKQKQKQLRDGQNKFKHKRRRRRG